MCGDERRPPLASYNRILQLCGMLGLWNCGGLSGPCTKGYHHVIARERIFREVGSYVTYVHVTRHAEKEEDAGNRLCVIWQVLLEEGGV
jgi:hypothetical protein